MHYRTGLLIALALFAMSASQSLLASDIVLNSPQWLGSLKLSDKELGKVKKAVEAALNAPIDAEQQCAEVRMDCVVRAAREWQVGSDTYREIVIDLHATGHTSHAIGKSGGKWPTIKTK